MILGESILIIDCYYQSRDTSFKTLYCRSNTTLTQFICTTNIFELHILEVSTRLTALESQLSSLSGEMVSLKTVRTAVPEFDDSGELSEALTHDERVAKALKRIADSNAPPPVELVSSIFQKAIENGALFSLLCCR